MKITFMQSNEEKAESDRVIQAGLARTMRKIARRVYRDWRGHDD